MNKPDLFSPADYAVIIYWRVINQVVAEILDDQPALDDCAKRMKKRLAGFSNAAFVHSTSEQAAELCPMLDFAYIDAVNYNSKPSHSNLSI